MKRRVWMWIAFPLLFFCVATLIMTYPIGFQLEDAVLDPADPMLNAWILAWDAHILPRDPLALYHANDFYPYSNTLAYSETLLGQALIALPVIWLTGNSILAVNVVWLVSFILSGWGMYVLVYHFTRRTGAALVAGMIFAFNPFRFAHVFHIQVLSAQWMPLAFFFLDRWVRGTPIEPASTRKVFLHDPVSEGSVRHRHQWRDWVGFAFCLNLQVLSSYYYALFLAVSTGVLLLGYWFLDRYAFHRRWWLRFVALVAVTMLIQIPLAAPYFKVANAMGFERSVEDAAAGGADITDFVTAPPENLLYGALTAGFRDKGWWEHVTFPSVVAFLLALLGVAWGRRQARAWREPVVLFSLLTGIALVLSLGPVLRVSDRTFVSPLPYRVLFDYVPGFRAVRQPARFHTLTMAGLSVLAGFGAAAVETRLRRRGLFHGMLSWPHGFIGVLVCLVAVENLMMPFAFARAPSAAQIPPVYRWLAEQPGPGPVLELPILMDVGAVESPRLYYSTRHWKRLVNGYGGFYPPVYAHFLFFDREFPDQIYDWILGLGVRYVILHRWQYDAHELHRIDARLIDFQDRLRLVADLGEDQVFEVIQPATGELNQPLSDRSLDGKLVLLGYVIKPSFAHPGETIEVALFWQGRELMDVDYTVFLHVVDDSGALLTQHDGPPVNGKQLTSSWLWDQVVVDAHAVQIPVDALPGLYSVRVGMYLLRTMERLPVRRLDGMIHGDFLTLGWLPVIEK